MFLLGKNINAQNFLKRRNFYLFLEEIDKFLLHKYFFFTNRYFLLQNHPFQAFLVSKTYFYTSRIKMCIFVLLRYIYRGLESSTITIINFSILGSNKRFFDKLFDGSWSESANTSLKLCNKYNIVLICSFRSIMANILQLLV